MTHFIAKSAVALLVAILSSSVAIAGSQRSCHFAFGSGVTEQIVDFSGMIPNSNIGFINLRIGRVRLQGTVDTLVTEGFNVPSFNPATGENRVTGFGKGTFDFGALGAFHTWEVDTVTLIGPPPWEYSALQGDIRTGPPRDMAPIPGAPPGTWGTGFFANADATFKGVGSNHFRVLNQHGILVNRFTYFLWGKICNVDLKGIHNAQRD